MKLFERTHRYVALTVEGSLLLPEARAIVQRVDDLSTLWEFSTEPRGPLRIASITAATIAVLPQVLPSYREAFPKVQLSVETGTLEDNSRALVERRVDVAFLRTPLKDPSLDGALVAEEQICVALPNDHPLCSRKRIPIRALDGADMVGMRDEFTGDFNKTMDAVLGEYGVVARSKVQTGSLETMLGLVASGMGIAIASATVRFMLVSGITLRPLEPRQALKSLWLAWRRDRENLPVIRSFRHRVLDARLNFSVTR